MQPPSRHNRTRNSTCPKGFEQNLAGGESLGDNTLERQLLLLEILGRSILDLELTHSLAKGRLDLLLLATLELERQGRVRDHLLNTRDVRLELLPRLELLAESLIAALELGGIYILLVSCSTAKDPSRTYR